ncbi:MAG: AbrB/MazE/SpoVT family DNA-binding domain-containing protein [Actinobacteria bacterium]|nr:AbrB/MazE/SpoVT family DNA-binding domain-containing protein [Actinomycetota bacterium]
MNLAKISSNGQITVPVEIRRKLNIKEGDKIIFLENANGDIILQNSSRVAIREAQAALKDIKVSKEDILQDVMEIRYSKGK